MKEEKSKIPESIRTALLALLKRKDYADIFMTEIAQQAHVGRRTLYRYFPPRMTLCATRQIP